MKVVLQKSFYSAAMLLAPALVTPPFLFFRRGRQQITDRYGFWNFKTDSSIWLHGASLGEMIGLSNIAQEFKTSLPAVPIVATATSPTGLSKAREFAAAAKLLPFDHRFYFERCVNNISPKAFVFGETEIWPNLLSFLSKRKIPSYLVNGRISERAFKRYFKFKDLVAVNLQQIDHIFAGSELAKERFLELGAKAERVSVVPNTKYDNSADTVLSAEEKEILKNFLFQNSSSIVIFSSIRPEEENFLFEAIKSSDLKNLSFIIAPRHSEKFSYFEKKLKDYGFDFERRSQLKAPCKARFLLLDTIGELTRILPSADLVFVGGTLVDYGGHNPLEPAACGVAPVVGPFCSSTKEVVQILRDRSAVIEAASVADIQKVLQACNTSSREISEIGARAAQVAASFAGTSKNIVKHILENI